MTSDRLIDLRRCASDKAAVVLASTDLIELIEGYSRCPHIVSTGEGTNYCLLAVTDSHTLALLRRQLGIPDGEDAVAFVERTAIEECCNPQEPSLGWWPVSGTGAKRGGWPIRRRLALPEAKP